MNTPPPARTPAPAPAPARSGGYARPYARRLAAFALALGGLLALLLGSAAPASAHAALIRTDPAQGSVVRTAPERVVLTFSEGVLLSDDSLRVLDPRGGNVAIGTPGHATGAHSGSTATIGLRTGLGNGTYTVAWRAVSQDSHPISGAYTFSIGAASQTTVSVSGEGASGGGAAGTLYGVARWFAYAGFALLIGASVFLSVCWPRGAALPPMRRLAAAGWATLVASTIAFLMLRGPYVNGTGLGDAFDTDVMRSVLETRPGAALLSRLLLLAAAAVFLAVLFGSYTKREDPAERADMAWGLGIGGSVVAVGIAATWAMAEHASVGIQRKLAMPVDMIHLLSMAVWLGGLVTLLTALWAPSTAGTVERAAVRRFSTLALTAVTTLICTGTYQAWRQVGSWSAFTDTSYGRLLLVKLALVSGLVGVAWFSRRWTRVVGEAGAPAAAAAPAVVRQPVAGAASEPAVSATAVAETAASGAAASGTAATETAVPEAAATGADAAGTADAGTAGTAGTAEEPSAGAGEGGERAAQLRRQQAARSAARAKKVRDADPGRGGLRRSVLAEVAVAVVLLSVTTMLTGTQPGRAEEEQKELAAATPGAVPTAAPTTAPNGSAPSFQEVRFSFDTGGARDSKGNGSFILAPARSGIPNTVTLVLIGPNSLPADVPEVRLAFTLPDQRIGPLAFPLRRTGKGQWTATEVQLPLPGTWEAAISIRTSDIDEATETMRVAVAP